MTEIVSDTEEASLLFLKQLTRVVKQGMELARSNPLQAAKLIPCHGELKKMFLFDIKY